MSRPIIIIIFLSLTLALGIGQIWPKYQELKFLEQRNKEKRTEIETKEKYIQGLKKMAEELKNYQVQLAKIDSALPSEPGLAALFNFFQKVSSQQGLVLTQVSPFLFQTHPEIKNLKETEVSVAFSGSYPSFKNFLSVLEKSARLIEVESISFLTQEKEGLLNFDLKIKVYSY